MESHYLDWHPEHIAWRDLKGNATMPNSVIFGDETLGRFRLKGKFHIDRAEDRRFFSFKLGFSYSLLNAGGSFKIEPSDGEECDLTAETHLGYSAPVIGRLVDRLLVGVLPLSDLRRHMAEEGQNLARLVSDSRERDREEPVQEPA